MGIEGRVSDSLPIPLSSAVSFYNPLTASLLCSPAVDYSFIPLMSKSFPDSPTFSDPDLPLSGKSSVTELKTTPSKVVQLDLPLSRRLKSLPDYSVSGTWIKAPDKHFIVTSGRVSMGEHLLLEGVEFVVTGFLGCGWDFLTLSLPQVEDGKTHWLVIPDCRVRMRLICWCCPIHHLLLHPLLCCLRFAFRTCQSRFGFVLVSKFLFILYSDLI